MLSYEQWICELELTFTYLKGMDKDGGLKEMLINQINKILPHDEFFEKLSIKEYCQILKKNGPAYFEGMVFTVDQPSYDPGANKTFRPILKIVLSLIVDILSSKLRLSDELPREYKGLLPSIFAYILLGSAVFNTVSGPGSASFNMRECPAGFLNFCIHLQESQIPLFPLIGDMIFSPPAPSQLLKLMLQHSIWPSAEFFSESKKMGPEFDSSSNSLVKVLMKGPRLNSENIKENLKFLAGNLKIQNSLIQRVKCEMGISPDNPNAHDRYDKFLKLERLINLIECDKLVMPTIVFGNEDSVLSDLNALIKIGKDSPGRFEELAASVVIVLGFKEGISFPYVSVTEFVRLVESKEELSLLIGDLSNALTASKISAVNRSDEEVLEAKPAETALAFSGSALSEPTVSAPALP